MLLFHWNALRIGDRVLVHDDDEPGAPLADGTVTIVQTGSARQPNDLAIRVADRDNLIRPRRQAVHFTAGGAADCWRCAEYAQTHPKGAA
jgi:hypothetical protein